MEITILCKVVDNFGDIGVVYRMAKGLVALGAKINIIVDDLDSFHKINSLVSDGEDFQQVEGFDIYNWNSFDFCYKTFSANDGEKLKIILECFQCGRPDWMEKILFEDKLQRTVQIIMIDYLTAEKYAEDFHLLDSLTRSAKVKKINFMPGFTEKTGGLVIGPEWCDFEPGERNCEGPAFVFTYERDWTGLVSSLQQCGKKAVVAQGKGKESFEEACEVEDYEDYEELPYVDQFEWDRQMKDSSMLFIRGEESMSRACLSGIPFVWHAYPQSEEYQLVKVNALLDRMSRHFDGDDFEIVRKIWLDFNSPEGEVEEAEFQADCVNFIENVDKIAYGFEEFALSLLKNGDLCNNLMTFINKKVIL